LRKRRTQNAERRIDGKNGKKAAISAVPAVFVVFAVDSAFSVLRSGFCVSLAVASALLLV